MADSLPQFPFQLADVYVYECRIERRPAREEDPAQPRFLTQLESADHPDHSGFYATLTVEVAFRIRDQAVCVVNVATVGIFVREGAAEDELERQFRNGECALLLWPYTRSYVGELVRMTGLQLPPLPTIDVRDALQSLRLPDTTSAE